MEADNGQQQPTTNISGEALTRLYGDLGAKTHALYELQVQLTRVTAERDRAFELLKQAQERYGPTEGEGATADAEPAQG